MRSAAAATSWVKNNWQYITAGAVIVAGVAVMCTGRVAAGCHRNPVLCVVYDAVRQLAVPPGDVNFIEAIHPRAGQEFPICHTCQGNYDRSQFPSDVAYDRGGPWDEDV